MERIITKTEYLHLVERNGWAYVKRPSGPDVVQIVAITEENNLILIEQMRLPINCNLIELPGGVVGDKNSETIIESARRELLEEAGYAAGEMILINTYLSSASLTDERVNICLASNLTKINNGGGVPEEGEKITVYEIPINDVLEWIGKRQREENVAVAASIYSGLFLAIR